MLRLGPLDYYLKLLLLTLFGFTSNQLLVQPYRGADIRRRAFGGSPTSISEQHGGFPHLIEEYYSGCFPDQVLYSAQERL